MKSNPEAEELQQAGPKLGTQQAAEQRKAGAPKNKSQPFVGQPMDKSYRHPSGSEMKAQRAFKTRQRLHTHNRHAVITNHGSSSDLSQNTFYAPQEKNRRIKPNQ